jgi:hypothetical protein
MIHCRCISGSNHSEVPVKPLWPMAVSDKALPEEVYLNDPLSHHQVVVAARAARAIRPIGRLHLGNALNIIV